METYSGYGWKTFTVRVSFSDKILSVIDTTIFVVVNETGLMITTQQSNRKHAVPKFPNPFNPCYTIKYALVHESNVRISVYNIVGQKVENVFQGIRPAGYHTVEWKAYDFPSGIYIYTIEVVPIGSGNTYSQNKKMIILK
jgi:hypothetical protein